LGVLLNIVDEHQVFIQTVMDFLDFIRNCFFVFIDAGIKQFSLVLFSWRRWFLCTTSCLPRNVLRYNYTVQGSPLSGL